MGCISVSPRQPGCASPGHRLFLAERMPRAHKQYMHQLSSGITASYLPSVGPLIWCTSVDDATLDCVRHGRASQTLAVMWQVLVPRASLAGHLRGIATGVLRAYAGPHGAAEAILLASL